MTRPNITPGLWSLDDERGDGFWINSESTDGYPEPEEIALASNATVDSGQALANARAIAAVPALLKALEIIHANAAESPKWIRRHTTAALIAAGYKF